MPHRNKPLTVEEANARLLAYGRRIVSSHPSGLVTTTTYVEVECRLGHRRSAQYGNIRNRGCSVCSGSFGERLLHALLNYYTVGPNDWQKMSVAGLVPNEEDIRLIFDFASKTRKIGFESHSAYHLPDEQEVWERFRERLPAETRVLYDKCKIPEKSNGVHLSGPLHGWRIGTVWFELKRVVKLSRNGNYLQPVIREFKAEAARVGLELRKDGNEINVGELYTRLARYRCSEIEPEFMLLTPWKGRTREHLWEHDCGHQFSALPAEVESASDAFTGCPYCNRLGRAKRWIEFLHRLTRAGFELSSEASETRIVTEFEVVPLRCRRHPKAEVGRYTRSKLYMFMSKVSRTASPCPECARIRSEAAAAKRRRASQTDFNRRLRKTGHALVKFVPSTTRDQRTGKVICQMSTIRCLSCGKPRKVNLPQYLKKSEARKRPRQGCSHCQRPSFASLLSP